VRFAGFFPPFRAAIKEALEDPFGDDRAISQEKISQRFKEGWNRWKGKIGNNSPNTWTRSYFAGYGILLAILGVAVLFGFDVSAFAVESPFLSVAVVLAGMPFSSILVAPAFESGALLNSTDLWVARHFNASQRRESLVANRAVILAAREKAQKEGKNPLLAQVLAHMRLNLWVWLDRLAVGRVIRGLRTADVLADVTLGQGTFQAARERLIQAYFPRVESLGINSIGSRWADLAAVDLGLGAPDQRVSVADRIVRWTTQAWFWVRLRKASLSPVVVLRRVYGFFHPGLEGTTVDLSAIKGIVVPVGTAEHDIQAAQEKILQIIRINKSATDEETRMHLDLLVHEDKVAVLNAFIERNSATGFVAVHAREDESTVAPAELVEVYAQARRAYNGIPALAASIGSVTLPGPSEMDSLPSDTANSDLIPLIKAFLVDVMTEKELDIIRAILAAA
jgi:hypothetical protein